MTFDEFLAALDEALQGAALKVVYNPTKGQAAEPHQILIGVGNWRLDGKPVEHCGVCLNNKGVAERFGSASRYASMTDFVLAPP